MTSDLFNRYTSVSITTTSGNISMSTEALDIFFELYSTGEVEEGKRQEDDVETYIELKVYNLSDATYSAIDTQQVVISSKDDEELVVEHGSDVSVESGYINDITNVFTGEVVDKIRIRDGGDVYTKITCVGGLDALRRTKINKAFFMKNRADVVRYIINEAGITEGHIERDDVKYTGTSYTMFTTAYEALVGLSEHKIFNTDKSMFFGIRANSFYWESNDNSPEKDNVHILNAETGMVKLEKMSGANVNVVFLVTTLMFPTISKGSRVQLSDPDTGNSLTCRVIYEPTHSSTRLTHVSEFQVLVDSVQETE